MASLDRFPLHYLAAFRAAAQTENLRAAAESLALYAPLPALDPATSAHLTAMREATEDRRKLKVGYLDLGGVKSERIVRPLACLFWGPVWTLAAWCELRNDFRSFRVDRVETLEVLEEAFRDEPGKTLADMNRQREAQDNGGA
eukprot:gene7036-8735_t